MSQYTFLSNKEVHAILAQYHLGKLNRWRVLDGGSANTNCKVETENGEYVMTVCDEKSMKDAQMLAALLEHLEQNNFHTSKIIRNSENHAITLRNEKPVMVKEYLQGEIIEDLSVEILEAIGEQLGRLHQIKVPDYLPNQFSYGKEQFHKLKAYELNSPFHHWLQNMEKYIAGHISDGLPRALIHGDIFTSNVIIDTGKAVIMDFEEACHYYRVFDLGMSIVGLCSSNVELDLRKVNHFLKGYRKEIQLTPAELKSLQAFTVYGAVATAFWRYRQFNFINPHSELYDHHQEMQNLADHVKSLPNTSFETVKNCTLKTLLTIAMFFVSTLALSQPGFNDVTQIKQFEAFDGGPTLGSGVNAIDYDKDGDLDLYVLSDENTPNRLYRNDGSGNFKVVEVGLSLMMRSRAAVWFDYDGDHKLDVFVAGDCLSCGESENFKLFRQLDNGKFENVTSQTGISLTLGVSATIGGVAAGDVNNDGYVDLLVTQYRGLATLYINNGNGQFTDATASSGIKDTQLYLQPVIFDFNKDGWADIYLTVDYTENKFWLNNGDETFNEISVQANLDNDHNDMGVALGDYDGDEDIDIYISNIHNPNIEGHHNVLLKNRIEQGEFTFDEVSKELGVEDGGWGWGVSFLDVNNDGFLDLAATNGWVTEDTFQSKLWRSNGEIFEDISSVSGFNDLLDATTLISFDFDRDGDLDMAQTLKVNEGQTVALKLLENQLSRTLEFKNYLVVKPRMLGANHWAIGAIIIIKIGDTVQTRPLTAGISFYGQEPAEAFFGVGDATNIDEVSVLWPDGASSSIYNIESNKIITIYDDKVLHSPVVLKVVTFSSESVQLTWKHIHSFENEYVIERSESGEFDDAVQFRTSSSTMEFKDDGLMPNTNYYYRIKATKGSFSSVPSKVLNVHTQPLLLPPTNLSGRILSNTSISLSWFDNASNEDGYILQRSQSEDFEKFVTFDLPPGSHYYEDENLDSELTYYYRVRAYKGDDASEFSLILSLSTVITSIEKEHEKINIYPNPSSGKFKIDIPEGERVSVKLMNASGFVLNTFHLESPSQLDQNQFDLHLPSGVYFLGMEQGTKNQVFKLIVTNDL